MLRISMEDRKDFIAGIATRVFSEKGYQVASMQDIALKAEISKAGIYHYFKTKEDILAYILLHNTDIFLALLKNIIKENQTKELSPLESFKILISNYIKYINQDNDKRQIVLRERHQLSGIKKKELLKREKEIFRLLRNELKKIKELNSKIDLNVISFQIIAISHWLGYWFKEGKNLSIDKIIEQNIFVILHGILN